MLRQSIRWRIQVWHGALLACLVAGMLETFYVLERAERVRAVDEQLNALLTPLLPHLYPPRGGEPPGADFGPPGPPPEEPLNDGRPQGPQRELPEFDRGPFYYVAWSPQHGITAKSSHAPNVPEPQGDDGGGHRLLRTRGEFRELASFHPSGGCVVAGVTIAPVLAQLRLLAAELVAAGLAFIAFGLAGGWWVAGHVLRPLGEIGATAVQIAGGDRSKRISLRETDSELGQLAAVLNHTFDRLDQAFEQQVQFTADASHELRTPVAVILNQSQVALSRERSGPEYRHALQICQRAAERIRALVNSLLELARMDSGEAKLTMEDCDLGRVAAEVLEWLAPLAEEKGAVLHLSVEPVRVKGDAAKLGRVLGNLLENAVQHNAKGVEISLSIQPGEQQALVRVADNGAGIAAEALPRLFDRFYRVDKSRAGGAGGAGLGLAISKSIVEAHGGTIRVESEAGKGTAFLVSLPLASAQKI